MREANIMVACGDKGVGKTYTTTLEMQSYIQNGNKCLVYDVNFPKEVSYKDFKRVAISDIGKLKNTEIRRVVPVLKNGRVLRREERKTLFFKILNTYRNGLVVLEDINKYIKSFSDPKIIEIITTNRHSNLDIIIHLQSLGAIYQDLWRNIGLVRFHYQSDEIDAYKYRIPNFQMMKIVELLVGQQYFAGNKRYYLYCDIQNHKIKGKVSAKNLETACRKYLLLQRKELKDICLLQNWKLTDTHFAESLKKATKWFIDHRAKRYFS